jgi:hypothetical protein
MGPRAVRWSVATVALAVIAAHLSLYPKVADLDGFYHLGHAAAYLEGSPFDTSFPWATQSAIRDHGADLWWGFHVVLMPLAAIGDVEWGVRLGALLLTFALAACFYAVLRRHGVAGAGWWTAGFLVAVPNVLFRYLMLRPHVLSVAAALVLLSVLARGRWTHVLAVSALIAWLHLALFWMAPGVVAAYALVRAVEAGAGPSPGWRADRSLATTRASVPPLAAIGASAAGSVLGWLLRPHPVAAAELAGIQTIRLFAAKQTEEPLLFSAELFPLGIGDLVQSAWLFVAVWLGSASAAALGVVRGRRDALPPEERTLLATALLVSAAFLLLAVFSARRAMVEWVAFGSLALPFAWRGVWAVARRRGAVALLAVLLATHLAWGARRHALNVDLVAFSPDVMEETAAFLAAASEPGDVVFHAKWDNFGPLFARNRVNVYLGGMDPIFQFAHDPRRYWEFFYLSADVNVEWTCDAFPCSLGQATDTHQVLREHFGARWVVVEPYRNPRLSLYLLRDPRFALAHDSQREAVFEVLPTPLPRS